MLCNPLHFYYILSHLSHWPHPCMGELYNVKDLRYKIKKCFIHDMQANTKSICSVAAQRASTKYQNDKALTVVFSGRDNESMTPYSACMFCPNSTKSFIGFFNPLCVSHRAIILFSPQLVVQLVKLLCFT